jgi:hypothetical protein
MDFGRNLGLNYFVLMAKILWRVVKRAVTRK